MNATQPNDADHGFAPPHNTDLMTEDGPDRMFDDNSPHDDDDDAGANHDMAEIDIIEAEIARHEQSITDGHDDMAAESPVTVGPPFGI